jgi:hypothetical protein
MTALSARTDLNVSIAVEAAHRSVVKALMAQSFRHTPTTTQQIQLHQSRHRPLNLQLLNHQSLVHHHLSPLPLARLQTQPPRLQSRNTIPLLSRTLT